MKSFRIALALLLVGALSALAPAAADAKAAKPASTNKIVETCTHDGYKLPGHYSEAALKAAYNSIPAATLQYTTCAQVIQNKLQQEANANSLTHGKGSGGGFPVIIVVIVVIVLLGGGAAFYSYRRSQAAQDADDPAPGPGPDA